MHLRLATLNSQHALKHIMLGIDGSAWLDRLHMQLARNLRSADWSQAEIADMLGSTQSTVSRMAHRPLPDLQGTSDEATIDGWAHEIAMALRQIGPEPKPQRLRFVMEIAFGPGQVLRFDKSLTGTDLDSDQEQIALLKRLEWAVSRIDVSRLTRWMPAVGMNIGCCLDDARSPEDVAAFPGKVTIVEGRLRHHETPSYGASNHIAGMLMKARSHDASKNSILNIRPPEDLNRVMTCAEELGLSLAHAPKGDLEGERKIDIILDEGAFGWEPGLYVLAHNPLELVDRMHRIISAL
jgi:predicted fused transcriptional regulator/phosphomethylpyrimidine kinase